MAKWTLPEGKIYTQADLDAAVTAALREAADLMVEGRAFAVEEHGERSLIVADMDQRRASILALLPDAGAALDRALAAEYLSGWVNGSNGVAPPDFGDPVFFEAAAIRHGSTISAQGET